jgi:hypothetical protein
MKMKKLSRIYLILAVFFGIIGIVQCIRLGIHFQNFTIVGLTFFLPAITCFISYFCMVKWKQKSVHSVLMPLCTVVILYWGVMSLAAVMFRDVTTEVTNVMKYDNILNDYWSNSYLVSHFPRPIPSDANNIKFSFLPSFLQGSAHIQLRYSTSSNKIAELYDLFSEKKTKSFLGGGKTDHLNIEGGMPTTCFYTNDVDEINFPDDYEIMVFDEVSNSEKAPWNHGKSHGVAISKKRNEIVYWVEEW